MRNKWKIVNVWDKTALYQYCDNEGKFYNVEIQSFKGFKRIDCSVIGSMELSLSIPLIKKELENKINNIE